MVFTHRAAATIRASSEPEKEASSETHFEWLARIVMEQDRRQRPFTYGSSDDDRERRRWDVKASIFASASMNRALPQAG